MRSYVLKYYDMSLVLTLQVASAVGECTILRAARDTARLDGMLLSAEIEDFKVEVESLMVNPFAIHDSEANICLPCKAH